MYVWSNPTRRERRSRKHDQYQPYASEEQIEAYRKEDQERAGEKELNRRILEKREIEYAMKFIRPEIEKYLKTIAGKKEIKKVVAEMKRLKTIDQLAHPPEEAILEELKNLERENPEAAGDPNALKELQKRQKVKDIFEVFDADASDAMDAEELKELLQELRLPCTDDDVAQLMETMDADGSGEIDFDEFYAWYSAHGEEMKKGHMLQVASLAISNVFNHMQGLTDIAEAKRIIVSHCEHEAKDRALRMFRLFRPPDPQALADSDLPEDHETPEEVERRRHRFQPVTNLLYGDGKDSRALRLSRLAFSHHLYEPVTTLNDLPIIEPHIAPSIGDGGTGRRRRQWRNGQSVEGLDARFGKRPGVRTQGLRSVRTSLAQAWNMTRIMHPTFTAIKLSADGGATEDTTAGNRLGVGGTPYADDPGLHLEAQDNDNARRHHHHRVRADGALVVQEASARGGGAAATPHSPHSPSLLPPPPGGEEHHYADAQAAKLAAVERQMAVDALQRQRARGGGQRGGKKRGRFMLSMPLLGKPYTAKLLQREQRNNARLRVNNLQFYPARSVMRRTVEPSMSDLLARLSHDAMELPRGARQIEYIPVGEQKAPVTVIWSDVVEKEVRLCIEGWGRDGLLMKADNVKQRFYLPLHLPAGRYLYRYKVDGYFMLDPDRPATKLEPPSKRNKNEDEEEKMSAEALAILKEAEESIDLRRNVIVVAPHSTEPEDDATRPPMRIVSLPQKGLGDDGVWVVKEALRFNRSVTALDLPTNSISAEGCCALGGLLGERPGMIRRLNLCSNGVGHDGCLALAMGLKKNYSLTSLELAKNRVGDDGIDVLATGLEGHRFLKTLELASNFIHDDGVEDLCRSLLRNNSLRRVGLAGNCVGPRGVSALCTLLRVNTRLRDVDLNRNARIGAEGAAFLGRLLGDRDCKLETLLLSGCAVCADEIDKEGVYGLALGLKRNKSLHTLGLGNNGISNWGARELAVAMQVNITLVSLDLDSNLFDDEWLRPAHTLHTEQDPSIRSIASCVLRNGELAMVPQNVRRWENVGSQGAMPGMLVSTNGMGGGLSYDARGAAVTGNAPGLGKALYGVALESKDAASDANDTSGGNHSVVNALVEYNDDGSIKEPEYPAGTIMVAEMRRERAFPARHLGYQKDQGAENARQGELVRAVVAEEYPDDESSLNSAVAERRRRHEKRKAKKEKRKQKVREISGSNGNDGDGGDFVEMRSAGQRPGALAGVGGDDGDDDGMYYAEHMDPDAEDFEPRDEGKWVPRGIPATPAGKEGSDEDSFDEEEEDEEEEAEGDEQGSQRRKRKEKGEELPPHWLNFKEQARRQAELDEALAFREELKRIEDENTHILAARLKEREECRKFIEGNSKEGRFGPDLIASLATNVIGGDRKKREKEREERRQQIERHIKAKNRDQGLKMKADFDAKCVKEDLRDLFDSFDEDCSESIDAEEMSSIMRALGVPIKPYELDELVDKLDTDRSGDIDFLEFYEWHKSGGLDDMIRNVGTMGMALAGATSFMGSAMGGDTQALKDHAERLYTSAMLYKAETKARTEFRRTRPPRRGCVCPTTGFAFPEVTKLADHKRTFNFGKFSNKQRAFAGRDRLVDRARESMKNGVPEYPRVMCFGPEVPKYIELTAYDAPDNKVGRPVGTVRHGDIVRCLSGDSSGWLRIVLGTHPEAWIRNSQLKYEEVLIPMEVGESPGDEGYNDKVKVDPNAVDDMDDMGVDQKLKTKNDEARSRRKFEKSRHKRRVKEAAQRKKGAPPTSAITFFDSGEPNAVKQWYAPDSYLPEGARLKIRDRPEDDADVVSYIDLGFAAQAVCSARDWIMVVYMETKPHPSKRMQTINVRREGWVLQRTSRRTLMVPVQDPQILEVIGDSEVSPIIMPEIKHSDSEDSQEELTPEQRKELKLRQRAANKKRMKKQAAKRKAKKEMEEERSRLMAAGDADAIAHALSEHMGKAEEESARRERLQLEREKTDDDSDNED